MVSFNGGEIRFDLLNIDFQMVAGSGDISNSIKIVRNISHCWCWWFIWPIQNDVKKKLKMIETLAHGTHLRVLSESFPMNTNMTGFRWFSKILTFLCFGCRYSP